MVVALEENKQRKITYMNYIGPQVINHGLIIKLKSLNKDYIFALSKFNFCKSVVNHQELVCQNAHISFVKVNVKDSIYYMRVKDKKF